MDIYDEIADLVSAEQKNRAEKMIIVYGIDNCQWCEKTKVLLDTRKTDYRYFHVADEQKAQFLDNFTAIHGGSRTFPRVVRNGISEQDLTGDLIGGFDQVLEEVLHGRI
ncbi:putative glutaredoxin [Sinorhizobium phage phiM9]|uniref:Putative glutaredoxin n=1 Tax=Sinorhizobium phage phiM9 TaxID=1636182 RepID=A0A0F6TH38_9CAUD|nr:putative glutaredoxin [Sinorhizobium phage phiM9]AKE44659.1 putative glutaredoxin [Sinorhizobium phage phiM9]